MQPCSASVSSKYTSPTPPRCPRPGEPWRELKPAALISADSLAASHRASMAEGGGGGLTPGKTERNAALMAINGSPPGGSPQECRLRPLQHETDRIIAFGDNRLEVTVPRLARVEPQCVRRFAGQHVPGAFDVSGGERLPVMPFDPAAAGS